MHTFQEEELMRDALKEMGNTAGIFLLGILSRPEEELRNTAFALFNRIHWSEAVYREAAKVLPNFLEHPSQYVQRCAISGLTSCSCSLHTTEFVPKLFEKLFSSDSNTARAAVENLAAVAKTFYWLALGTEFLNSDLTPAPGVQSKKERETLAWCADQIFLRLANLAVNDYRSPQTVSEHATNRLRIIYETVGKFPVSEEGSRKMSAALAGPGEEDFLQSIIYSGQVFNNSSKNPFEKLFANAKWHVLVAVIEVIGKRSSPLQDFLEEIFGKRFLHALKSTSSSKRIEELLNLMAEHPVLRDKTYFLGREKLPIAISNYYSRFGWSVMGEFFERELNAPNVDPERRMELAKTCIFCLTSTLICRSDSWLTASEFIEDPFYLCDGKKLVRSPRQLLLDALKSDDQGKRRFAVQFLRWNDHQVNPSEILALLKSHIARGTWESEAKERSARRSCTATYQKVVEFAQKRSSIVWLGTELDGKLSIPDKFSRRVSHRRTTNRAFA